MHIYYVHCERWQLSSITEEKKKFKETKHWHHCLIISFLAIHCWPYATSVMKTQSAHNWKVAVGPASWCSGKSLIRNVSAATTTNQWCWMQLRTLQSLTWRRYDGWVSYYNLIVSLTPSIRHLPLPIWLCWLIIIIVANVLFDVMCAQNPSIHPFWKL